ncbi:hypothetical protein N7462_011650 [Penicillium macrosclerotiorum]|uniref:uncharacterized protein n=1 Tax=Penicillium macrosclerotiorum TaxID=303699 RepID=UPI00254957F3|nr:uncharacterized protein N7462_011650 [Penicillium macrosclerotiorum]KAJ5662724.1 hypothetical protein N7462_011650 [Penicillium macrosclerotiorum]
MLQRPASGAELAGSPTPIANADSSNDPPDFDVAVNDSDQPIQLSGSTRGSVFPPKYTQNASSSRGKSYQQSRTAQLADARNIQEASSWTRGIPDMQQEASTDMPSFVRPVRPGAESPAPSSWVSPHRIPTATQNSPAAMGTQHYQGRDPREGQPRLVQTYPANYSHVREVHPAPMQMQHDGYVQTQQTQQTRLAQAQETYYHAVPTDRHTLRQDQTDHSRNPRSVQQPFFDQQPPIQHPPANPTQRYQY